MKTLRYNIEIRDKDDKLYLTSTGAKVRNAFFFEETNSDETLIHLTCIHTFESYKAICKEGSEINIEVSYHDSISNTSPVLYSFYGAENKFIKH